MVNFQSIPDSCLVSLINAFSRVQYNRILDQTINENATDRYIITSVFYLTLFVCSPSPLLLYNI